MSDNRNKQLSRLLGLIHDLGQSRNGSRLRPLCEKYGVTRRTLERDLLALEAAGYIIETVSDETPGVVRKRLAGNSQGPVPALTAVELAVCHAALGALRQSAAPSVAAAFELVVERLEAAQPAKTAVDAEALRRAQAFVPRPGPFADVKPQVLDAIQRAILTCHRITVTYRKGGTEPARTYEAEPYGLLYGARNYLVWRGCEDGKFRKFALPYIDDARLGEETFVFDEAFNVAEFAARSVGVMLDEEVEVELRILPAGRPRLETWRFHPHQRMEEQGDGSLVVRFRAAGVQDLAPDLLRWGGLVQVVAPTSLRDSVLRLAGRALEQSSPDAVERPTL
ncbi:helix-turn-helix transcriptional regulator [Novispirillum sp. DQ9]|uniref:helix-turn-helix transcriptional regulator n=1 Tax=Novispirillum sp. DQ9 TaxID=3398612 RepID=UPI003C7B67CA